MPPTAGSPPPEPGTSAWDLLLSRYISGESSVSERARVEAWAAASPVNAKQLEAWRAAWLAVRAPSSARFDVRAAERSLERRLDAIDAAERGLEKSHTREVGRPAVRLWETSDPNTRGLAARWVWRIAASIAVVAGGALTLWRAGWLAPAQQFREFASAPRSRTTITLVDGTRLVLGPATHLRVPRDFGVSARTVSLDGEAEFVVVHDARRPFAVETKRAVVRDVGTTFIVRAYADDGAERVGVEEGAVTVGACRPAPTPAACDVTGAVTSLTAGDLATIASRGVSLTRAADLRSLTAWTTGGLAFDHTPLADVAREIGRTFGVSVTIGDPGLDSLLVTATFADQPLDLVLAEVTRAVGARYEQHNGAIVIRHGVAGAADHSHAMAPSVTTAVQSPNVNPQGS